MVDIKWKDHDDGKTAILGTYRVGNVFYDLTRSRGSEKRFRAVILLPGIRVKKEAEFHESMEGAMHVVEVIVKNWIKRAGLCVVATEGPSHEESAD